MAKTLKKNKTRKCIKCNEEKELHYFKNEKLICNKCKREKNKNNFEKRFKNIDLGLKGLNTNLENIIYIREYNVCYKIDIKKAIELIKENEAKVYKEDIIYSTKKCNYKFLKEEILERDNYICYYCGKFGKTVDHIIPISKGGEWKEDNLVCCCRKCNTLKADKNKEQFIKIK